MDDLDREILTKILEKIDLEQKCNNENNKGIVNMHYGYVETNNNQNKHIEYQKIKSFLHKYMEYFAEKNKTPIDNLELTFINYDQTEIVYILKNNANNYIETLLVKQPAEKFGNVKIEYENLKSLAKKDKKVINPIDYFCSENQELYVTPYINQTRCVASYDTWGVYVPEPYYRFVPFNHEQESIVNTCMIAKLISLYDFETETGLSRCKLGGGDFMLEKGFENKSLTISNILNNLYLIAARSSIKCSFPTYLDILRDEFSKKTIDEDQNKLLINLRGRVAMSEDDIEKGIILGKTLLEKKDNNLDDFDFNSKKLIKNNSLKYES